MYLNVFFKKCNDCNAVGKHGKIKKRGFDAEENKRPADVSQKDHVSEPVAANTELEPNGTMFAGSLLCYCVICLLGAVFCELHTAGKV